jgi:hypothetical protein
VSTPILNRYEVTVQYSGSCTYEVEATDREAAEAKACDEFESDPSPTENLDAEDCTVRLLEEGVNFEDADDEEAVTLREIGTTTGRQFAALVETGRRRTAIDLSAAGGSVGAEKLLIDAIEKAAGIPVKIEVGFIEATDAASLG